MEIVTLLAFALSLSMDAFAVSVCKGLHMGKANWKGMATCGLWFGGFQALMPLTGYFLGRIFATTIEAFDHWVAFGLLALIGINMLREAFEHEEECCCNEEDDLSFKTMFPMAIATSIDALAVGISFAMAGNINIWLAVALIGIITCALSAFGVKIGSIFGSRFERKAQIAGGVILILLGLKVLLEHLHIL